MVPYIILGVLYAGLAIAIFFVRIPKNKRMQETDSIRLPKVYSFACGTTELTDSVSLHNFQHCSTNLYLDIHSVLRPAHARSFTRNGRMVASAIAYLLSRHAFCHGLVDGKVRRPQAVDIYVCFGSCFHTHRCPVGQRGRCCGHCCTLWLHSLLFPTIYGVSLSGVGADTKFASSGLVMAIVGGAVAPMIQGAITDATNPQIGFSFVILCFVIIGAFGLMPSEPSGDKGRITCLKIFHRLSLRHCLTH